jgi:hypothetical protein
MMRDTAKKYDAWLSNLYQFDRCFLQTFCPAEETVEHWRLERVKFGERIHPASRFSMEVDTKSGLVEGGDVFPYRIVPIHWDFDGYGDEAIVCTDRPLYEPLLDGRDRHIYFVPYGINHASTVARIRHLYPLSYGREVNNGELWTVFVDSVIAIEGRVVAIGGSTYLYSEPYWR